MLLCRRLPNRWLRNLMSSHYQRSHNQYDKPNRELQKTQLRMQEWIAVRGPNGHDAGTASGIVTIKRKTDEDQVSILKRCYLELPADWPRGPLGQLGYITCDRLSRGGFGSTCWIKAWSNRKDCDIRTSGRSESLAMWTIMPKLGDDIVSLQ